ncbi:MAG: alginate biosynthesis protein AlgK, partial [Pseudomonas sp.]
YRLAADSSAHAQARLGKLLASKPGASPAERREAAQLLEQALAAGEASSLMPLAALYLNYPQNFPAVNLPQRIGQWRQAGYPQAELVQIGYYRAQGSYAEHLGEIERICRQALSQADVCYEELASVYQMRRPSDEQAAAQLDALLEQLLAAYQAKTVPAQRVEGVAQVLADAELGTPDENRARQLLEQIAPAYPAAWVSLARLLYDYPGLGDVEQLLEYLEHGRAAALPRAELLLGKLYYEGKLVAQDPKKAEAHLLKAVDSELSAHYYLGLLYARGYLGRIAPDKALRHLLRAARGGQSHADFALAQWFAEGRGIQVNRVNAYVFSQLALRKDNPQASALAQEIQLQLLPAQRSQAERLLNEERQLRASAGQNAAQLQAMHTR